MSTPEAALVDSRLGPGTLTIATIERSYQIASVSLKPDISDDDGMPTLAQPDPPPLASIAWALTGSAIQDFGAGAESFLNWLMDNALSEAPFEWVPITATAGLKYTGTVQVRPVEIGGDAGVQITTDFELPLVGPPVRVDPAVGAARSGKPSMQKD